MTDKAKCISCDFCGVDDKLPGKGNCYHKENDKTVINNILIDRKCQYWKLGVMHSVQSRKGFKS